MPRTIGESQARFFALDSLKVMCKICIPIYREIAQEFRLLQRNICFKTSPKQWSKCPFMDTVQHDLGMNSTENKENCKVNFTCVGMLKSKVNNSFSD